MKLPSSLITLLSSFLAAIVEGSILNPSVLPLIVRNPYLHVHLANSRDVPWSKWPIFWTGQDVGLSIMARVPETRTIYPLLGRPHDSLTSREYKESYNITFPQYLGAQFDASTTNLTYLLPKNPSLLNDQSVELTVSFISPITPTSTLRQSIPASYIEVSTHGNFDIEIYMDVNAMWVTGDEEARIEWTGGEVRFDGLPPVQSWQVYRQNQMKFAEQRDRAEYGKMRFTTSTDGSFEAGASKELRHYFAKYGKLKNCTDTNFRRVMEAEPVFAFQKLLSMSSDSNQGRISNGTAKALFTLAHIREELVQFASAKGLTVMKPLWRSYLFSDPALISYHFWDFDRAKLLSTRYSRQLSQDAQAAGGLEYVDIVSLSARQVLGAVEFSGTLDNPLLFLKEISSNGNSQTIDVIFPSSVFFMYTNPVWLAYLLEPLLEHMLSGQYPNKYAMHDLGFHYPNLTGHPLGRDEYMPVEECGNMLIMGAALVNLFKDKGELSELRITESTADSNKIENSETIGDQLPFALKLVRLESKVYALDDLSTKKSKGERLAKAWLRKSYAIWEQWTEYLIKYALEPENQLCTDDFAGWLPLQTNLALKGIIGIKAMSELAALMGYTDRAEYYRNISATYVSKWQEFGLSRDASHAKLSYDWYSSWTTLYSLFADTLLCFHTCSSSSFFSTEKSIPSSQLRYSSKIAKDRNENFISQGIYANQSSWYALSMQNYGLPLDSRHLYTKSDWEFQVAAVASPSVRKTIIEKVAKWINETETDGPLTDWYDTEGAGGFGGGEYDAKFKARPVVGSHFSLLVLKQACGGKAMDGLNHWNEEFRQDES